MFPTYSQNTDWKKFFTQDGLVPFFEETVQEKWIPSGGTQIHLDIYYHSASAPTIIYSHGLSTCGRIMGYMVKPLYEKGYNVICPDLVGFGMTTKKYGSGTVKEFVQNLVDVVNFAKKEFEGPRYLAGISLGGGLSYYAAASGADVSAIACLCLMDLGSRETLLINKMANLVWFIKPILWLLAGLVPNAYIPMRHFLNIKNLCSDQKIVDVFKTNPLVINKYTFSAGYSLITSQPKISFEKFDRVPVLVLHGTNDVLVPDWLSRLNYEKLPGKKKYVALKGWGHIPVGKNSVEEYAACLDEWFRECRRVK